MATATDPPVVINGNGTPTGVTPTTTTPEAGFSVRVESTQLYPPPGVTDPGGVTITRERTLDNGNQRVNQIVVNTGNSDDDVQVSQRSDGKLDITVNGKPFEVTLAAGQELAVRTNDGNDIVNAASNVKVNMTVNGGAGNDTITTGSGQDRVDGGLGNDTITTNDGKDYVFGNSGDDTINTGAGDDVAYGGDGNDQLVGGDGRDFINGGKGNDTIDAGKGNDVLSGGEGDDTVRAGEGNDRVYIGPGSDNVQNSAGNDVVYGQTGTNTVTADPGASNERKEVAANATLGSTIKIEGDDAFKQRVEADLDIMRSSPQGREMLAAIDAAAARGNEVTIRDNHGSRSNSVDSPGGAAFFNADGTPGDGTDAVVRYGPSHHIPGGSPDRPPVVGLYHELAHAYNVVNGTLRPDKYNNPGHTDHGIGNFERQAIGQDTGVMADYDRNPATPNTNTNPEAMTERAIRTEMGLDPRDTYRMPTTPSTTTPGGTTTTPGGTTTPEEPHMHEATSRMPTPSNATPGGFTIDPHVDRMLAALQTGNYDALRAANRDLAESPFGKNFINEGIAGADQRDQKLASQSPPVLEQTPPPTQDTPSVGARRQ